MSYNGRWLLLQKNILKYIEDKSILKQWIYPLCLVLIAFYFCSFLMHYIAPQAFWAMSHGEKMLNGEIPYRDFYTPLPICYNYISMLFTKFCLNSLYLTKYFGIAEKTLLVLLNYWIARTFLDRYWSFLVTLASFIIWNTVLFDLCLNEYITEATIFVLTGAIAIYLAIIKFQTRQYYFFLILSAILMAVAFHIKHTTGACVTVASIVVFSLVTATYDWKRMLKGIALWGGIYAVVFCLILLPIILAGAFQPFLQQVFCIGVPSSKGSLYNILWGFISRFKAFVPLFFLNANCLLFFLYYLNRCNKFHKSKFNLKIIGVFITLIFNIIYLGYNFPIFDNGMPIFIFYKLIIVIFPSILFLLIIEGGILSVYKLWVGPSLLNTKLLFWFACSFAVCYAGGMSGDLCGYIAIPGLACSVAFIVYYFKLNGWVWRYLFSILCLFLIFFCIVQRTKIPYSWHGWQVDSLQRPQVSSRYDALRNFTFSDRQVEVIDRTLDIIHSYSKSTEPIFSYPVIPFFNIIAQRPYCTFATVHYWDYCPDYIAEQDLLTLQQTLPPVIIYLDFPEGCTIFHEKYFRNGKKSAQRKIADWIKSLVQKGDYQVVMTSPNAPNLHGECPLWVLVRKDRFLNQR